MPPPTRFLSRLLGLYFLLFALSMVVQHRAPVDMVTVLMHDRLLIYVIGIILVFAGLAMVLGHNVWSGGVLPVVVTVVGWLALGKGLFFLFAPPDAAFFALFRYDELFFAYLAYVTAFGAYLTYAGFKRS